MNHNCKLPEYWEPLIFSTTVIGRRNFLATQKEKQPAHSPRYLIIIVFIIMNVPPLPEEWLHDRREGGTPVVGGIGIGFMYSIVKITGTIYKGEPQRIWNHQKWERTDKRKESRSSVLASRIRCPTPRTALGIRIPESFSRMSSTFDIY